jgi:hypothetical protein
VDIPDSNLQKKDCIIQLFFFGPKEFSTTDSIVSYQSIEEVFFFMLEKCPDFIDALFGFKLTGIEP